ncbi:MAG: hypothetical protein ACI9GZ_003664, partial [Bacteroidia bacterium]
MADFDRILFKKVIDSAKLCFIDQQSFDKAVNEGLQPTSIRAKQRHPYE